MQRKKKVWPIPGGRKKCSQKTLTLSPDVKYRFFNNNKSYYNYVQRIKGIYIQRIKRKYTRSKRINRKSQQKLKLFKNQIEIPELKNITTEKKCF